jgi:hypothetical protein
LLLGGVLFLIALFLHLAWWHRIDTPPEQLDVFGFHRAAALLLSGHRAEIYPGSWATGLPFVYPPTVLYLFLPLGLVSAKAAYALVTLTSIVLLVLVLRGLADLLPIPRADWPLVTLAVLAAPPWTAMLMVGNVTMLWMSIIVAGFVAWHRGQELAAGCLLAVLATKPTLAPVFPLLGLVLRRTRLLAGMAIGYAGLFIASLPLGLWDDYAAATGRWMNFLRGNPPWLWKHMTLYAFWRLTAGGGHDTPVVFGLFVVGAVAFLVATVWVVSRRPDAPLPRLMGVAVLLTAVIAPYLFYYDTLLFVLPGLVWYLARDTYRRVACWRLAGAALIFAYVWEYLSLYWLKWGGPLVGPAIAVWLVAELVDLGSRR